MAAGAESGQGNGFLMQKGDELEVLLQKLLAAHRQKHNLLTEMLKITNNIKSINEGEQAEEILELIKARQICMEKVDAFDVEVNQLKGRLEKIEKGSVEKAGLYENGNCIYKEIEDLKKAILSVAGKILELDRQQRPRLDLQLAELKKKQHNLHEGRRIIDSYNRRAIPSEGVFIDKQK